MEKMHITNQEHDAFVKSHPNGDITINEMGRNKEINRMVRARRIAVGRDGEVQGVAQLLLKKYLNYLIRYVIFRVVLLLIIVIKKR